MNLTAYQLKESLTHTRTFGWAMDAQSSAYTFGALRRDLEETVMHQQAAIGSTTETEAENEI